MPSGQLPIRHYAQRLLFRALYWFGMGWRTILCAVVWLVVLPAANLNVLRGLFWGSEVLIWGLRVGPANSTGDATNSPVEQHESHSAADDGFVAQWIEQLPSPLHSVLSPWTPQLERFAQLTFEGQILTCMIVVLFVGIFLLREWVLQHLPHAPEAVEQPAEPGMAERRALIGFPPPHPQEAEEDALAQDDAAEPDILGQEHQERRDRRDLQQERRDLHAEESLSSEAQTSSDAIPVADNDDLPPPTSEELMGLMQQDPATAMEMVGARLGIEAPFPLDDSSLVTAEERDQWDQEIRQRVRDVVKNETMQKAAASEEAARLEERNNNETSDEGAFLRAIISTQVPNYPQESDVDNNDGNSSIEEDGGDWEDVPDEQNGAGGAGANDLAPVALRRRIIRIDGPQGVQLAEEVPINGRNEDGNEDEFNDGFDEWDDVDAERAWEDDMEGILEAVGITGPITGLLQNLGLIMALSSFALFVLVSVPYQFGRLLGTGDGYIWLAKLPIRLLRLITDPLFDGLISILGWTARKGLSTIVPGSATTPAVAAVTATPGTATLPAMNALDRYQNQVVVGLNQLEGWALAKFWDVHSWLNRAIHSKRMADRAICVLVGDVHLTIALTVFQRVCHAFKLQVPGWLQEPIQETLLIVKVGFFICIELVAFPLGCGILLDLSMLPIFPGSSVSTRICSLAATPLTFVFLHWVAGTLYMFIFAQFVSLTRDVARPGVLCWIRDPNDPNFQPVKEILEKRSTTQMAKIGTSVLMYAVVGFGTVGVPSLLFRLLFHSVLPIRTDLPYRAADFPIDLFGILVIIPWLVRKAKPSKITRRVYARWWKVLAARLRLSSFLRGGRHFEEEGNPAETTQAPDKTPELDASDDGTQVIARTPPTGSFARVPADNNAIMSTALVIRTDSLGIPLDDKGKQAVREQHAAIAKMSTQQPRYTIVYIPPNFRLRLYLFVGSLWLSGAVVITGSFALPLVVGRACLDFLLGSSVQIHDGHSYFAGACVCLTAVTAVRGAIKVYKERKGHTTTTEAGETMIVVHDEPLWRRLLRESAQWIGLVIFQRMIMPLTFGMAYKLCERA